jgi:L-lactate dehydrogenase complex protein LldG
MTKGLIKNRDAFLENIASSLRRKPRSDITRPTRENRPERKVFESMPREELLKVLRAECGNIHTKLVETKAVDLPHMLAAQLEQNDTIVIPKDPRFKAYGLSDVLHGEKVHTWNVVDGASNIDFAERANCGIMFSDITLAESATTVIFNDKHKARAISLLPETFLAIIPASTIVPRMTQAAEIIDKQVQDGEMIVSCVNFISGPSNSADIEYNLVVGVHGPVKATYIVVVDK